MQTTTNPNPTKPQTQTPLPSLDHLKFDQKGLIPAIVIDRATRQVLTLAYMSRESLTISLRTRLTCFWSRSRRQL